MDETTKQVRDFIRNNNVDIKSRIEKSILKHGKDIYQHQVKAIKDILESFLIDNKKNVVLSAPTGSGKSIIGLITYDVLGSIFRESKIYNVSKSYILLNTNSLVSQYDRDYSNKVKDLLMVKGGSNYPCLIHSDNTANDCVYTSLAKKKHTKIKICDSCEYMKNKNQRETSNIVVSNYHYFITKSLYANGMKDRLITIYDESHTFNDAYASNAEFEYNISILNGISTDLKKFTKEVEFGREVENLVKDIRKITDSNYNEQLFNFTVLLFKLTKSFKEDVDILEETNGSDNEILNNIKILSKYNKYISSLRLYKDKDFEFVTEVLKAEDKKTKIGISLRPIFISELYEDVKCSPYNLFMSGTNDIETFKTEIGVEEYKFIKLPPVFPQSHKKVHLMNYNTLNYTVMKDQQTMIDINEIISDIIEEHEGQNGLIITPSFYVSNQVERALNKNRVKNFTQKQGEKLNDYVESFIECKKTSVLVSPSAWEGIDLVGDTCEFIIIVKCPFASLGDVRQKYIADKHSTLYRMNALKKVIQGSSRGVRNFTDVCDTYMIDTNISKLFKSNLNLWKDEFEIVEY